MARCDEGYLCEVCGREVDKLEESDLYLRYILGMVDPDVLHAAPERHLSCNPSFSQYIVHTEFSPVEVTGDFDKRLLDPVFVADREAEITSGYERLLEVARGETSIFQYPQ